MGFKCHRADRNCHGGGIIAYIRNDLPHRRRNDIEIMIAPPVEALVIEVIIRNQSWLFICLYSPHNKHKHVCCNSIDALLNTADVNRSSTVFIIGDLNINALCKRDFQCLKDVMDVHDLSNLIDEPTCFKSENNSLLDFIITSNKRRVADTLNLNTGISDFHNLVAFSTKMHVPKLGRRRIQYRTFKNFDETSFKHDIEMAPYHVGERFDDFDDTYWFNHTLVKFVMDNHAPLKHKQTVKRPVPFMNSKLRKACHQKAMLRNRYFKNGRTKCSWEHYRKIRNHVAKLKSTSIQNYFAERCSQNNMQNNPSKYWETVKPFMTDKMKTRHDVITLQHNGKILNDPSAVSNIFNDYFSNVALEIGDEKPMCEDEDIESVFKMYENHESVKCICENMSCDVPFYFSKVTVKNVESLLRESDSSKASGYDNIPPKLLKVAAKELAQPIATLVNKSVIMSHFPSELKKAELSPLFKSNGNLNTQNYRPLSILTSLSKIFEKIYNEQLYVYFQEILSTYLSAFRKRYGCHHVLTKLIEDCKHAIDSHKNVGLILLDLSKAFDCLPHRLLLCKLRAYGVSRDACQLIKSYLCNRLQRVKVASVKSEWTVLPKGVPQGSVLGPLLFNIFLNDIFHDFHDTCSLYNYADDNTLSCSHSDLSVLKTQLEDGMNIALKWFYKNQMKANPSKFQFIVFKNRTTDDDIELAISNEVMKPVSVVKLLGITIDDKMSFDEHISRLCIKAARQTNALRRIAKHIPNDCRLNVYNAFITSNFNYCSIVWHFCSRRSTYKIEKINKKALRITLNDYVSLYSTLLGKLEKQTLYVSRLKSIALETMKCVKKFNPTYMNELFMFSEAPYKTRGGVKLIQPKVNTTGFGINSFSYQGAKIWNVLPEHVKDGENIAICKEMISKWPGPQCSCGTCIMCNMYNIWQCTIVYLWLKSMFICKK